MSAEQVVVFLDWQNVYMRARESFHPTAAPNVDGQVDPLDLALTLTERGAPGTTRELKEVRIYRGLPDQHFDPKAYAAYRRQVAKWSLNNRVKVFGRTLRYPEGWMPGWGGEAPREKGVDVALAVDVVTCGLDHHYDTGIVMSSDQDLTPALEYIERKRGALTARLEVAAWKGDQGRRPNRITVGGGKPYCHWLSQQDYWGLQDTTDFNINPSAPTVGTNTRPVPRPPGPRL